MPTEKLDEAYALELLGGPELRRFVELGDNALLLRIAATLRTAHDAGFRAGLERAAKWHVEEAHTAELAFKDYAAAGKYAKAGEMMANAAVHQQSAVALRSLPPQKGETDA